MAMTRTDLSSTSILATSSTLPGLSSEQLVIALHIKDAKGNLLVRARAGTGKTYLIRKAIPLMFGKIAIAAYNRKIAAEIRVKLQLDGLLRSIKDRDANRNGTDVGTFHSFGNNVLRLCLPGFRLEGRDGPESAGFFKFDLIAERLSIPACLKTLVRAAMERAQERLFGVTNPPNNYPTIAFSDKAAWLKLAHHYALQQELPSDDHIEMQLIRAQLGVDSTPDQAREVMLQNALNFAARGLQESIRMARETFRAIRTIGRGASRKQVPGEEFTGVISFSEMLYLPLYFNMPIPQYDFVCVDEAQDSNPARREMARRMMKPGGRIMFVGDDRQAIYGWAGADNDALDQIITQFGCTVFPMTVTFRCGKAIVRKAQTIVPDYKAADGNAEGIVRGVSEEDFAKETLRPGTIITGHGEVAADAIICRNTAPLIKIAYKLIGRGVACHVEGRDIGKGLSKLINRWPSLKTMTAFTNKLADYRETETAKLKANQQEAAAEKLDDQIESILAIIEGLPKGARVTDIQAAVDGLFSDTKDGEKAKTVTLLTAHRAKGLEFDRVFGWGVEKYMPSPYAKQDWSMVQEENLKYVLFTRAINEYVDVAVP
jgi:superfamily I DNA/RNA helicase